MWCTVLRNFNSIKGGSSFANKDPSFFVAIPPGQQQDSWMQGTGPEPG